MSTWTVTFMFDGQLMKEDVSSDTPAAARRVIAARYPGCHIISAS